MNSFADEEQKDSFDNVTYTYLKISDLELSEYGHTFYRILEKEFWTHYNILFTFSQECQGKMSLQTTLQGSIMKGSKTVSSSLAPNPTKTY